MYIERVPNRSSPPAVLLRESIRDGDKVRKRTLANLSHWPAHRIETLRAVLRGADSVAKLEEAFEIVRSRPHGHVAAVLGMVRKLGLVRLLGAPSNARACVLALVVARVIVPSSKLATARALRDQTLLSTLGELLELGTVDEDGLYAAMDWLLKRQPAIETALAKRHLSEGTLVLYDVSSSYFEGRCCSLGKLGHSRDGQKGKLQIVYGLLCDSRGCPVAVEVFDGNTADPKTLAAQIEKLRSRFGLRRVVLVGDRGMLTEARIRDELRPACLDWISSLRAPAIRKLLESGSLQLSLFDQRDLAEITAPAYPGERLIVCKNPLLAEERTRKRNELLAVTERELERIVQATVRKRNALRGKDKIAMRVGAVLERFKMGKHFDIDIDEASFRYARRPDDIAAEASLDGIYVVRTNVAPELLDAEQTVAAYKSLSHAERAFRSLKTVDLKVRPIYHWSPDRVRAHVFVCMLAYYVEWHMRQALAPLLFDDHDKQAAASARTSIVQPARVSERAKRKAATKLTDDGLPVHSFQTLLKDLGTIVNNRIRPCLAGAEPFDCLTKPTTLQQRAFSLLAVPIRL